MFEIVFALLLCASYNPVLQYEHDLGATDWKTRVRASQRLLASGDISLCRKLLRHSHDPEVHVRTARVYERLRWETVDSMKPYPRLHALWLQIERVPYTNGSYTVKMHYDFDSPIARRLMPLVDPTWFNQQFNGIAKPGGGFAAQPIQRKMIPNEKYIAATRTWLGKELDSGRPAWLLRMILWEMRRRDALAAGNMPYTYGR